MLTVRNTDDSLIFALVAAQQQRMLDDVSTTSAHKAKSGSTGGDYRAPTFTELQVTAATATDSTTSFTLVNNLKAVLNQHYGDVVPHNTSTSAQDTTASATNTATAITLANHLKSTYNAHSTSTSVHYNAGSTVTNANATDLATLETLLNEMKTVINAHISSAPNGLYVNPTAS